MSSKLSYRHRSISQCTGKWQFAQVSMPCHVDHGCNNLKVHARRSIINVKEDVLFVFTNRSYPTLSTNTTIIVIITAHLFSSYKKLPEGLPIQQDHYQARKYEKSSKLMLHIALQPVPEVTLSTLSNSAP